MAFFSQLFASFGATKAAVFFLVLLLTSINAVWFCIRSRGSVGFTSAAICTSVLIALVVSYGAYESYSSQWRAIAKSNGVYNDRKSLQFWATIAVSTLPSIAAVAWAYCGGGKMGWAQLGMFLGVLLLTMGMLRVISFHPVDHVLATKLVGPISLGYVVNGVLLLLFNLVIFIGGLRLSVDVKEPEKTGHKGVAQTR